MPYGISQWHGHTICYKIVTKKVCCGAVPSHSVGGLYIYILFSVVYKVLWNSINIFIISWLLCSNTPTEYGPGSSVGIATELQAGRSRIESRCGRDFLPVRTGPGTHPASCKMGTRSFLGVECGQGTLLTAHTLLVPWSWKSRAIPLPSLWPTPGLLQDHFTFYPNRTEEAALSWCLYILSQDYVAYLLETIFSRHAYPQTYKVNYFSLICSTSLCANFKC